jgi:pimeloyl-ACP methyl ester carboxylesterase
MSQQVEGFLKVGEYDIHYVRWGYGGSRIVLLHSMGMDAHSMDLFVEALSADHRVLALTILGHGDSTVPSKPIALPDHAELMRQCFVKLGFTPCVLIGHSIGGRMGMILAAEHPEEARALVLVDIAPPDPAPRPWSQQTPDTFRGRKEALAYLKGRYPRFAPEYYENRLRHGFKELPDGSLRPKPAGNEHMRSISTDLWPYVERIGVPTLLIIGSESELVTPEKLARMKRDIKGLTVVTIRGATHMVPQDKPTEFEKAVREFMLKLDRKVK